LNETVDDPALGRAWKIDVRLAPTSGTKADIPFPPLSANGRRKR